MAATPQAAIVPSELRNTCRFFALIADKRLTQIKNTFLNSRFDETLEELTYGLKTYDLHRHALMCVAPGQIGGKADIGEEIQTKGWALLFDPELLHGSDVERRMSSYTYFSYNTN